MRVLVVQLKRLGDLILTTPALQVLRHSQPGCHIALAVTRSSGDLLPLIDHDEALVFARGPGGGRTWLSLLRSRFDWCFDFTGNDRAALVSALSRAPRRVGYARFQSKPLRRSIFTDWVESSVRHRHTVDHHLDLLTPLTGPVATAIQPSLKLPASDPYNRKYLSLPAAYAVVHPGTARAEKFWIAAGWVAVIEHLVRKKGWPVLLTGAANSLEAPHYAEIKRLLPADVAAQVTDLSGQLSLSELASVIAGAHIVCGVDSAPLHLADALHTPVVALFGPTNPHHWKPRGTCSVLVTAQGLNPSTTPDFPASPMEQIPADFVVSAVGMALPDARP